MSNRTEGPQPATARDRPRRQPSPQQRVSGSSCRVPHLAPPRPPIAHRRSLHRPGRTFPLLVPCCMLAASRPMRLFKSEQPVAVGSPMIVGTSGDPRVRRTRAFHRKSEESAARPTPRRSTSDRRTSGTRVVRAEGKRCNSGRARTEGLTHIDIIESLDSRAEYTGATDGTE
jgi:hypothetical protein